MSEEKEGNEKNLNKSKCEALRLRDSSPTPFENSMLRQFFAKRGVNGSYNPGVEEDLERQFH